LVSAIKGRTYIGDVSENGAEENILDKRDEVAGDWRNYVMSIFLTCTLPQI
jgi:hypothetical protein